MTPPDDPQQMTDAELVHEIRVATVAFEILKSDLDTARDMLSRLTAEGGRRLAASKDNSRAVGKLLKTKRRSGV